MSIQSASSLSPSSSAAMSAQRSPWHSPVPYLFGGLAAMLGLIAFALLILACSYWKLSGYLDNRPDAERDLESGDSDTKPDNDDDKTPTVLEEKYLVIMAGEARPTYLATPVSSIASSFGGSGCCSCRSDSTVSKEKEGSSDELIQGRSLENRVIGEQLS
ncbi:hypothetical protein L6452_03176 [Arctium lappa]|uniref:Uncharacterized protein n=1 Tax=Arctium lappa TaxID=4217 RepID=A0ACB9FN38_ARCLA|nr:hypothetical protein L6452_03176 [Arctium lappa]